MRCQAGLSRRGEVQGRIRLNPAILGKAYDDDLYTVSLRDLRDAEYDGRRVVMLSFKSVDDFEGYEWSLQRVDREIVDEALSEMSGALNGHREGAGVEGVGYGEEP